jgi:hypothetical protein
MRINLQDETLRAHIIIPPIKVVEHADGKHIVNRYSIPVDDYIDLDGDTPEAACAQINER